MDRKFEIDRLAVSRVKRSFVVQRRRGVGIVWFRQPQPQPHRHNNAVDTGARCSSCHKCGTAAGAGCVLCAARPQRSPERSIRRVRPNGVVS
eukprot:669600-Rhodomonas_salina.1